ncbi:DUF721 domain-containing protein [Rarobacter incanus]|uniref:Putative nucleic acid-binding Zn ribbon protein n=1 Tax=Rarobacter incanus TaxID=153494 RepID=A0A542SPY6_9MICO|nr:DciA family protein [Rarobacter incanus]TQK76679.1 putative nucleic acid-binding Zn ribbon protein [Rarobacter incanus]
MSSDQRPPLEAGNDDQFGRELLDRIKGEAKKRGAKPRRSPVSAVAPIREDTGSRDPRLLGESLASLVKQRGWANQLSVGAVLGRWPEIVGDVVAQHTEPTEFTNGVLTVRCSSTTWATQLRLLTNQLLAKFDSEVGEGVVTAVKILGPSTRSFGRGPKAVRGRGPRDTWG